MASQRPVALVTGAATGIGKAAADALADAGYDVVGTSRHGTPDTSGTTKLLHLDVTDDDAVAKVVDQVIEEFGHIDVLVNNAGLGSLGAGEETPLTQDQALFDVNFWGTLRTIKAVLPHMREQRSGRIVNISSVVGLIPLPYMAIYSASKHAIEGYSWSLDQEVREYGIHVATVEPAWTRTGFDVHSLVVASPVAAYDARRKVAEQLVADAVKDGQDPSVVAKVVVEAATDKKPKSRYTAGSSARVASLMTRLLPSGVMDQQMRKLNKIDD